MVNLFGGAYGFESRMHRKPIDSLLYVGARALAALSFGIEKRFVHAA